VTTPAAGAVDAEVRRLFGEVGAFLDHPELGPILRKAAEGGWDNTRLFGALQQTTFWRTTGESARKWTILKTLDPATAKQQADQQTMAVADVARSSGFNYTPEQQRYFAELSLKNGWNGAQLREHLFAREANGADKTGNLDNFVGAQYGYLAAFLDEPEIGDILRKAARQGWDERRLSVELGKTKWWQTTTDAQRRWQAMSEQNPAEATAAREGRVSEITSVAQRLGVTLNPDRAKELAESAMRFGWSGQQLQQAVSREYEYTGGTQKAAATPGGRRRVGDMRAPGGAGTETPGRQEFGAAGQAAQQVKQLAAEYLVPISPQMMERWVEQIVRGETDITGFQSYLTEQAKSLFPGLSAALDRGVSVAQYADPYRQIAARELELSPESIDLNDPRYRKMLDQQDAKGGRVSMTLSESTEYLRKLPEWQKTRGANEKAASLTENILRTFGAIA